MCHFSILISLENEKPIQVRDVKTVPLGFQEAFERRIDVKTGKLILEVAALEYLMKMKSGPRDPAD